MRKLQLSPNGALSRYCTDFFWKHFGHPNFHNPDVQADFWSWLRLDNINVK
jgi:hypothetical protein